MATMFLRFFTISLLTFAVANRAIAVPPSPVVPTQVFVAASGKDTRIGSRSKPKRTFQAAHDAVAAGGQIIALDTADYGKLTITKSVDVLTSPGVRALIAVTGPDNAITVNAASTDVVNVRGLVLTGGGHTVNNGSGILAPTIGTLIVQDTAMSDFVVGVNCFADTNMQLDIDHVEVRNCAEGIVIANKIGQGQPATVVTASVANCFLRNNSFDALNVLGQNDRVDVTLSDCVVTGNNVGIRSQTPGGANTGIVRVDDCRITGNTTGISITNTGQVLSRGNNTLENNASGNTFSGTYGAK